MGDDLRLRTDGQTDVFVGQIIDEGATPGDVMTVQSDGSLAAESGGSQPITGDGSPVGVVTPSGPGVLYLDTTNGGLYISVGVTSADWQQVGGLLGGFSHIVGIYTGVNGTVQADNGPNASSQATATLVDTDGNSEFPGSLRSNAGFAAFGVQPPASIPATPVLLSDVIAILQGAGLCS